MESLALLVSLILLAGFIGGPVALGLSFIRRRWLAVVVIVFAIPAVLIGGQLLLGDGGGARWLGLIFSGCAVGAAANSILTLRRR